jgi:hypothetical protein
VEAEDWGSAEVGGEGRVPVEDDGVFATLAGELPGASSKAGNEGGVVVCSDSS